MKFENMKKADLIEYINCLQHNLDAKEEQNRNQFAILTKFYLERVKYRWHDLRKDPTDLPEEHKMVYVYGKQITGELDYMMDMCSGTYHKKPVWMCSEIDSVIAWREIEPFEEANV